MCPGVGPEAWLRWFAHPFGGAVCRGFCFLLFLLLLLALQKWQLGFFGGLFLSFVQNLPQLCMHAVIFSPLWFLCILLFEERVVQVQALQQRVPGPRSQPVSARGELSSYDKPSSFKEKSGQHGLWLTGQRKIVL